jgi:hypothetical protein
MRFAYLSSSGHALPKVIGSVQNIHNQVSVQEEAHCDTAGLVMVVSSSKTVQ